MHSEATTDLSKLRSNIAGIKEKSANVVLISTGSFNPVHRCHLSNLIRTKDYFSKICGFNVLAGFLSPTHDEYVQSKLGEESLSSQLRIQLCQKAIKEENQEHWLTVDQAEAMAPQFCSMNEVTHSLKRFINQSLKLPQPIRVIYVAGLDLFNRCKGMNGLRQQGMDGVVVVYRYGEDQALIESHLKNNSHKVAFIPLDQEDHLHRSDVSSTLIRNRLRRNEDCSHLTYQSVLQHLQFQPVKLADSAANSEMEMD